MSREELLTIAVLAFLVALAILSVSLSVLILRRGRLYKSLKPESRPRRWVLFFLLVLFAVFLIWFPIWILWPKALISRILTVLFGLTFFVVGMTLKWLSWVVDWFYDKKGWDLR